MEWGRHYDRGMQKSRTLFDGIDINPSLTIVARARLTSAKRRPQLLKLAQEIVGRSKQVESCLVLDDLLTTWLEHESVTRVRKIQQAIHEVTECPIGSLSPAQVIRCADEFSQVTCFFYCALFSLMRDLLRKFRTTNPMWIKKARGQANRIRPSWSTLVGGFTDQVGLLCRRLTVQTEESAGGMTSLLTGNATRLPYPKSSFDGALTSPPYATRMDYVKGTMPELALLGADTTFVNKLRKMVTGTPVVKGVPVPDSWHLLSKTGRNALKVVSRHSSKGSSAYYFPWLRNYLQDLQSSMAEVARVVKEGGTICMVIQDSYYKEYHIDLQAIVSESMCAFGRELKMRSDYSTITPRSRFAKLGGKALARTSTETVLLFG